MVSTPSDTDAFEVIASPNAPPSPLSVTIKPGMSAEEVLVTITPPSEPQGDGDIKHRGAPVDFVLTIDISGSMGEEANIPGDTEKSGLTILDIVKHAAKTIITTMSDKDRIGIVTFHTEAKVELELTQTNEAGKKKAIDAVERLKPEDSTNLWGGLKSSLNLIKDAPAFGQVAAQDVDTQMEKMSLDSAPPPYPARRLSSIFLLTDGLPNVNPPRGHIPMLKQYISSTPAVKNTTINAMGFGYNLDSLLLHSIAQIGKGTFGFIADSGMVGTVFVHAVANAYATWCEEVELEVCAYDDKMKNLEIIGGFDKSITAYQGFETTTVKLDPLLYGQARDVLIKLPTRLTPGAKIHFVANAKCAPWDAEPGAPALHASADLSLPLAVAKDAQVEPQTTFHDARLRFSSAVWKLLNVEANPTADRNLSLYGQQRYGIKVPNDAKKTFEDLVKSIEKGLPPTSDSAQGPITDTKAVIADIKDQVVLALSDDSMYRRWGIHYLLSLARAHQRQTCINFKDGSIQSYGRGSKLFEGWRDEADTLFDNLPPPKPSVVAPAPMPVPPPPSGAPGAGIFARYAQRRAAAPAAPTSAPRASKAGFSMSSYNSRAAPCFSGKCSITLGDGTKSRVDAVRKETMVKTPKGPRKVVAIVKTEIEGGLMEMCELKPGGLLITPWHPIRLENGDKWVFPADVVPAKPSACEAVYSILLEADNDPDAHGVYIAGTLCATLGHGITVAANEDVRAHAFLGSHGRCAAAIKSRLEVSSDGVVEAIGIERSEKTGLMNGFTWK